MSKQVSRGSAGDFQADEEAGIARLSCQLSKNEQGGVTWLSWRLSKRWADTCHAAQLGTFKQKSRQVSRGSACDYQKMSRKVSRDSAVDYQKNEQAGVTRLSWPQSSRRAGRCRAAQLAYIKQMSRQVSCGSVFDYQADEQAGIAGLSWPQSSR